MGQPWTPKAGQNCKTVYSHAKQGIIRVYNQFKYDAQKKASLESWAQKLKSIVTGKQK